MSEPIKGPWLKRTLIRVLESLLAANQRAIFGPPAPDTPQEKERDVTPEKKQLSAPDSESKEKD